jgi:large subunit ribosomal protein L20
MVRVKRGNVASKRRKKYIKLAKGYVGSNSRLSTFATEQVIQGLNFAYISRRLKKRNFRSLWIHRINAASRIKNKNYSNIIGSLRKSNILINRKMLSFVAFQDQQTFNALIKNN